MRLKTVRIFSLKSSKENDYLFFYLKLNTLRMHIHSGIATNHDKSNCNKYETDSKISVQFSKL